jgi:hypothetical protein
MRIKSVFCSLALAGIVLGGAVDVEGMRRGRGHSPRRPSHGRQEVTQPQGGNRSELTRPVKENKSEALDAYCTSIYTIYATDLLEENQKIPLIKKILENVGEDPVMKNDLLKLCNERIPVSEGNEGTLFSQIIGETTDESTGMLMPGKEGMSDPEESLTFDESLGSGEVGLGEPIPSSGESLGASSEPPSQQKAFTPRRSAGRGKENARGRGGRGRGRR